MPDVMQAGRSIQRFASDRKTLDLGLPLVRVFLFVLVPRPATASDAALTPPRFYWRRPLPAIAEPAPPPRYHWRRRPAPPTLVPAARPAAVRDLRAVPESRGPFVRAWQLVRAVVLWKLACGFAGATALLATGSLLAGDLVALAVAGGLLVRVPVRRLWVFVQHQRGRIAAALGRLRLSRARLADERIDEPDGAWVRLVGRVMDGPGFRSVGGWNDCVLAYYLGAIGVPRAGGHGQAELHAVDFAVLGPGREIVHVEVEHAQFLARPVKLDTDARPLAARVLPSAHNPVATVYHQEVVQVGEEVELYGRLYRQIDRAAGGYRTPGLRLVLRGEPGRKLLVRGV